LSRNSVYVSSRAAAFLFLLVLAGQAISIVPLKRFEEAEGTSPLNSNLVIVPPCPSCSLAKTHTLVPLPRRKKHETRSNC
jgi:hypothetical protein